MPTTSNEKSDPEHERNCALILSIIPDDSQPLTQFSQEQSRAYLWAIQWLHDYNLDRRPKPNFSDEILARLTGFHETQMNDHFRSKQAAAAAAAAA